MNNKLNYYLIYCLLGLILMDSCRKEPGLINPQSTQVVIPGQGGNSLNFYLLNEGNMGSNKSSLDFYDNNLGIYKSNIYGINNPSVPLGLGDVGTDIAIYGSKLYIVLTNSNKVEILDKYTAKRLGQINIHNGRFLAFYQNKVLISSYDGFVGLADTSFQFSSNGSAEIQHKISVGRQPEQMAIIGDKLYVANSGGYSAPNYDSTVSVVDLNTMQEIKKIPIAINLFHIVKDDNNLLWISSRGNYLNIPSSLYILDPKTLQIVKHIQKQVGGYTLFKDKAYFYSVDYDLSNGVQTKISYFVMDTHNFQILNDHFIDKTIEDKIQFPYLIAIDPVSEDIYLSDGGNYVNPGMLYCFNKAGILKWQVMTGDIPGHIAFVQ